MFPSKNVIKYDKIICCHQMQIFRVVLFKYVSESNVCLTIGCINNFSPASENSGYVHKGDRVDPPPSHLTCSPLDTYPLATYPLRHTYPTDFKMPYLAHASCVDYILHKHFAGIAFICDAGEKDVRYLLCQVRLNPHYYSGS